MARGLDKATKPLNKKQEKSKEKKEDFRHVHGT